MRLNNLYKWAVFVGLDVSVVPGWSTRGHTSFAPKISLAHWIAGPSKVPEGKRPSLNVIVNGHSTLPGPLAQDYMGRGGECVLVAAGRANHAGKGLHMGVTGNTGAMGTEAECSGPGDWTAAQRKVWPLFHIYKLFAMWEKGLINWGDINADRCVSHAEFALPKGRKVDINGYEMSELRADIDRLLPEFKRIVARKPIKVGTKPVYDWATGKFTTGATITLASAAKPAPPKPTATNTAKWPDAALAVTSTHTTASHEAWVELMRRVGYKDAKLGLALQKWLRRLGYYKGLLDGNFGPLSVKAMQTFLKRKGYYTGLIDGKRGPMTVRAEIAYLNDQRKYL